MSTAQSVERAIQLAQEAVKSDEAGDLDEAIRLYMQSVELIKHGLQDKTVDNAVLLKYKDLYCDRIAELRHSLEITVVESAPTQAPTTGGTASGAGAAVAESTTAFVFDDDEEAIKAARPPAPCPTGAEEWRRPFWLMGILRTSMLQGGYMSSDARVFVPRRVWVQKGGKLAARDAKLECAQCLVVELQKVRTVFDFRQVPLVSKELERLGETMDTLQTSLARVLSFVPDLRSSTASTGGVSISMLTQGFKGLAKTLDKTAARLGAMPSKASNPSEYVRALASVFEHAAFLEPWLEHYVKLVPEQPHVLEKLHRCAAFLYEVVCAFVIQDLDALIQRHMRKALAGFVKGAEKGD
jgi:hypothetical protein